MGFIKSKELRFSQILYGSFYPRFSRKAAYFFKELRKVKLFVVRTNAQRRVYSVSPGFSAKSKKEKESKTEP